MEIGVVSDTHGRLATAALHALAGVALIVHAGDIGSEVILRGRSENRMCGIMIVTMPF